MAICGPKLKCCCAVVLYFWVGFIFMTTAVWSRFNEWHMECENPPQPANYSGVKVMVAGFAKTGTRTMSRALYQIGYDHSYHSEEFNLHVWAGIADRYWLARNGGRWSRLPIGIDNTTDLKVLEGTSPEELAYRISLCKVDAIAFDGIEMLFKPVYNISKGTKVIMLNWRSYEKWKESWDYFSKLLTFEIVFNSCWACSLFFIGPWPMLQKLIDPLMGRPIEKLIRTGGPPICQVYDWSTSSYHGVVAYRRISLHWASGLGMFPSTKENYDNYFREIKEMVPPEDLLEIDIRKANFEDLCEFLGISPCPRSGRLPRAVNSFLFQREFPGHLIGGIPTVLALHYLNYKIIRLLYWLCCRRREKPGEKLQ